MLAEQVTLLQLPRCVYASTSTMEAYPQHRTCIVWYGVQNDWTDARCNCCMSTMHAQQKTRRIRQVEEGGGGRIVGSEKRTCVDRNSRHSQDVMGSSTYSGLQTEPALLTESVEVHIDCGDVLSQGVSNHCVCRGGGAAGRANPEPLLKKMGVCRPVAQEVSCG